MPFMPIEKVFSVLGLTIIIFVSRLAYGSPIAIDEDRLHAYFCDEFDWVYLADEHDERAFSWDLADIAETNSQVKLQAAVVWEGLQGMPVGDTNEHVALAFSKEEFPYQAGQCRDGSTYQARKTTRHGEEQTPLFDVGAGITLSSQGLGMELWLGGGNAIAWSAEHQRCAVKVPSGEIIKDLCLSDSPSEYGYITYPHASFELLHGNVYWIRMTLRNTGREDGFVQFFAELLAVIDGDLRYVQQGMIHLKLEDVFGDDEHLVLGFIGRTGPEVMQEQYPIQTIKFAAFDSGF